MKVTIESINIETNTVDSVQSITIGIGSQGVPGPPGSGFIPSGAWDAGTDYPETALVEHAGSAYYTTADVVGVEPPDAPWVLLVSKGDAGADSTVPGPIGPAGSAATITVGSTTTGAAGSSASVTNTGTSSAAVFEFTVPRGDTGVAGSDGSDGADGREVELQKGSTHIQWRYDGDSTWIDLVALSDLKGADGADGQEVSLRVDSGWIEWRLGAGSWQQLVSLASLKGDPGTPGAAGADGASAYEVAVSEGFVGDEAAWLASLVGPTGATGAAGSPGAPGAAGADGSPQWQGAWSAGTYAAGEAVSHAGSSYVANTSTSQQPPGSDWDLLAAKGDTGSGGTPAWGDITGTLSNQTDLDTALGQKADASSLAAVATSGAYGDLSGTPTLGTAAAADVGDFATSTQGGKADSALQPGDELTDLAATGITAGHVPKSDGNDGIVWAAESGGGGGGGLAVRHDNTGTYDYTGSADSGTPEGSTGWSVTRITLTSPVVIEYGSGAWTNRASLSYS